jgi:hypothetical protein
MRTRAAFDEELAKQADRMTKTWRTYQKRRVGGSDKQSRG